MLISFNKPKQYMLWKKSQNNLSIDNCCFKNNAVIKTRQKNYKNHIHNKYKDIYGKKKMTCH